MMKDIEMLFDYDESLKRLNRSQSEIDSLRNVLSVQNEVPKSITDKLVSKSNELGFDLFNKFVFYFINTVVMFFECL